MLLSALLFGLTHLNFNQMSYAVLVGIVSVLLLEGSGSIFYSMLFHICINTTNVVQMLVQKAQGTIMSQEESMGYRRDGTCRLSALPDREKRKQSAAYAAAAAWKYGREKDKTDFCSAGHFCCALPAIYDSRCILGLKVKLI